MIILGTPEEVCGHADWARAITNALGANVDGVLDALYAWMAWDDPMTFDEAVCDVLAHGVRPTAGVVDLDKYLPPPDYCIYCGRPGETENCACATTMVEGSCTMCGGPMTQLDDMMTAGWFCLHCY